MKRNFLLIFLCALQACSERYNLVLHPLAGSKYRLQMQSSSDINRKLPQRSVHSVTSTNVTLDIFIDDQGTDLNSDKKLRLQFVNITTRQMVDNMPIEMNSDSVDVTDPTSIIMNQLKGVDFIVIMKADGKVSEVKGKDALFSKVVSSVKDTDTLMRSQLMASLKTFMSDEIIANLLEQGFYVFPGKQVAIGDEWTKTLAITKPMPMNIANKFTLRNIRGNEATLASNGTITPGDQQGKSVMGYVVKTELSGTQTGELKLDVNTGVPISNTIKQNIDGKMISMGHSAPIVMQTSVEYTIRKLD